MIPVFVRKKKDGTLQLADSLEAISVKREQRQKPPYDPPKTGSAVRRDAEERVRHRGGDVGNQQHLLGQFRIQFGLFRNETFVWLAENALGYIAHLVSSVEKEAATCPKGSNSNQINNWVNKMALKKYLRLFPEGNEAISMKVSEKKESTPLQSLPSSNQATSWAPRQQKKRNTSKAATVSYVLEDDISDLELASLAKNIERQDFTICGEGFYGEPTNQPRRINLFPFTRP